MTASMVMWSGLVIPWLSLFFLRSGAIRRYIAVALFVTVINTIISQLAWHYHWWTIEKPIFTWSKIIDVPLVYSIFPVGTMWLFAYTYRRFIRYLIANLLVDAGFAFGISRWLDHLGLIKTGSMAHWQVYMLMVGSSVIIYLFQMWVEGEDVEVHIGTINRIKT
ncbi:hypothetical protein [Paenibacillus hexagrammi]|uniref:Uncharacterized protein n=1 Tax=Paenibacillus hexagrammi TaxID=2908839 RepID=A0ABY3SJ93_9BACL|nr:hypothetical protein [Paenibacillus sp. YPD9-1]UJF33450.1 hypothetical protein L0M14_28770 [Paenibacillus sp. YPD9-1]